MLRIKLLKTKHLNPAICCWFLWSATVEEKQFPLYVYGKTDPYRLGSGLSIHNDWGACRCEWRKVLDRIAIRASTFMRAFTGAPVFAMPTFNGHSCPTCINSSQTWGEPNSALLIRITINSAFKLWCIKRSQEQGLRIKKPIQWHRIWNPVQK